MRARWPLVLCSTFLMGSAAAAEGYNWEGFYAGLNAGGGFANSQDASLSGVVDPTNFLTPLIPFGVYPNGAMDTSGFVGGAQIGYNLQWSHWVFGLETDFSGADIDGSSTVNVPPIPLGGGAFTDATTNTFKQRLDWLGTLRGRLGYAIDNWLLFASAGLAYGHVNASVTSVDATAPITVITGSNSETKAGWAVGGGAEYGVGAWVFRAEYLYFDLGHTSVTANVVSPNNGSALIYDMDVTGNVIRGAVSHRF
jgi:outer membrane immunogenic protein